MLGSAGADPRSLIIELTESTIVDNLDSVARTLDELSRLGVRSAIDDFGTGYTSLQYLSVLPVASELRHSIRSSRRYCNMLARQPRHLMPTVAHTPPEQKLASN